MYFWRKVMDYGLSGEILWPSMHTTTGGTVLEAESANYLVSVLNSEIQGFTGKGYLETRVGEARHHVKWTFNAPESGGYIHEMRYSFKREQVFNSPVEINGINTGEIEFWNTGNPGAWV